MMVYVKPMGGATIFQTQFFLGAKLDFGLQELQLYIPVISHII